MKSEVRGRQSKGKKALPGLEIKMQDSGLLEISSKDKVIIMCSQKGIKTGGKRTAVLTSRKIV